MLREARIATVRDRVGGFTFLLISIVLGLVYLEETHQATHPTIRLAVMATVLLSILAHGLTAKPGIDLYARKIATLGAGALEHEGTGAKTTSR